MKSTILAIIFFAAYFEFGMTLGQFAEEGFKSKV